MWYIVELIVMLWGDSQEMLFIAEFKSIVYLCVLIFLETQFDLQHYFVTQLSFKQNTLTWALPTCINCWFVTLILKEETTKIGHLACLLLAATWSKQTWSFSQGLYWQKKSKPVLFNSISRNWTNIS